MKIFLNGNELNFELENEKNSYDVINSIAEFSSSQTPQQFITNIFIDDREYSFADENGLKKINLDNIENIQVETSDIFGISILSIGQMVKFLKIIENIILSSKWDSSFTKIIETMSWMKDGVEHIASIFANKKNTIFADKINFIDSFDKLDTILKTLNDTSYPIKPELYKNSSFLIKEMNSSLDNIKEFLLQTSDFSSEAILKDIDNLIDQIDNIIPKLTNIPILFQTGQDKDAMEIIQFLTKILEGSITLFVMFKENLKLYLDKYTVKEVSFEVFFNTLTEHLKELMTSIENKDSIMISDLLEYEFIPNVEEIKSILTKIKNEAFINPN